MESYSSTKINIANYCIMRLYLRYFAPVREKPLKLSAYVKGRLMHNLIEHFWDRLGTFEEVMKKSSKKKYYDSESFGKYAQGKWKSRLIADKNSEEKIIWNYYSEPWIILSQIERISIPLFDYLIEKGEPMFSELPFEFIIDNKKFCGKIDEIRFEKTPKKKIIIRDYKSGNPWMTEMALAFDPQLTLYNTGLCSLLKNNRKFARKFDLEEKIEEFMQGNKFISPNIEEQFFMIEALDPKKNIQSPIFKTERRDEHFLEILKMIKGYMKNIEEMNIYPERGKKCGGCDMRHVCSKELENIEKGLITDKKGQMFLGIVNPLYIEKEKSEALKLKQKRFYWRYKK